MRCPDEITLKAFLVGDLAGDDLERVVGHLSSCRRCERTLEGLEVAEDGLLRSLRRVVEASTLVEPPVPAALLLGARSAFSSRGGETGRELVVDTGRHFAHRLESEGPCRLGRFELLEELGVGSFGYVFRARDSELDRFVAVKIQRASSLSTREETDRFLREARSAAQLEHPGIVSLYETGRTEDGAYYLVTEFVRGHTLEAALGQDPPGPRDAAELVARIADALQYAHDRGVIHRDVKPSNVLVDDAGRPHVTDFGLAKREAGEVTVTADGEIMGTPAYMSPEQACGDSHHVDARSDLFSLGVILYELLTGERPFQGNRRLLLLRLLEDDPIPPRRLNERVPRDLEIICLKAMEKSPSRRYDSAGAMAQDLRRALRGEPIQARPAGPIRRLRHWCRRNPLAASLFAAVTIGSSAGLLYLSSLSEAFVRETARHSAEMQAEILEVMNAYYSEIVAKLEEHGVELTNAPEKAEEAAVPLPATFTIEAGRRISDLKSGMQVHLYSDFPFPGRTGPRDQFEWDALEALRRTPGRPYYQFTQIDGRPVLRFASARIMQPSCIGCHNTREDSPKTDWQVGDVRGVLQIVRPLHKDIARVRVGLRGSFILVGVVSALMLGVGVLLLVAGRRRKVIGEG